MKSVYISCPISIRNEYLDKVWDRLQDVTEGIAEPCCWERGEDYDINFLLDSDAIVIIHPNNAWKYNEHSLPKDVKNEINKALDLDKKVFGLYENSSGELNFYDVISGQTTDFELVKGSANSLYNYLQELNNNSDEIINPYIDKKLATELGLYEPSRFEFKDILKKDNNEELLLLLR